MSLELIGTTIAFAAVILLSLHAMRREIAELHRNIVGVHRDVADLRERMARLEGLFEGFTRRITVRPPDASPRSAVGPIGVPPHGSDAVRQATDTTGTHRAGRRLRTSDRPAFPYPVDLLPDAGFGGPLGEFR